jgi:hypothetical protein
MMSLYKPLSVDVIPELILVSWRVFEVSSDLWEETTRHFVGYNIIEHSGRVSSPIKKFDKESMTGTTRSGRTYQLKDSSGCSADGLYVWDRWCEHNEITNIKDVTDEYDKEQN